MCLVNDLLCQNEWDDNNDGVITWEEALDEFQKIFLSKINDKRDHWVSGYLLMTLINCSLLHHYHCDHVLYTSIDWPGG